MVDQLAAKTADGQADIFSVDNQQVLNKYIHARIDEHK